MGDSNTRHPDIERARQLLAGRTASYAQIAEKVGVSPNWVKALADGTPRDVYASKLWRLIELLESEAADA